MKRILFTLALALMGMNAFAQTITGRLVDDGGQPVAFANVALYRDTILISGTSSGEDGSFAVPLTPSGSTPKTGAQYGPYRLEALYVGYERLAVRCTAGDDLGTLTMNRMQLREVEITASRITEEVNRYVVLPKPEEVEAAGRTLVLLDMLGLPGLKVDVALQSITVDGGLAILQINGKEVPVARLANLRAEHIKRVEYSNNPGIRYLDRGASGIINIILKEREDGGSIVANGNTAFTTGFANGYLQGSYHVGKSEFALEYSLGYRNYDSVPYEMEDSYLDPMRTVTRSQRTNMPFRYTTHDLTAEYTYQHDDSTMFVAALKDNFFTKTLSAYGTMTETDRGTTITQTLEQQQHQRDNLPSLDLYFTHRMPRGRKVELNVVGEYSVNRYDNTLTYSAEGFAPATYATDVDGHGYALSAEGAYSVQLGTAELRTGLQYQHNFAANDYTLNGTTTSMTKDNAYLYAELAGSLGSKVGYSLGTGAKLFNVSDGTDNQRYLRNLSTARLQWRINQQFSLTATAQYTPILPTLASLSPVFQQTDDVEGQQGNPDLKPSEQLQAALILRYTHPKGYYVIANSGLMHIFHPYFDGYQYNAERDLFVLSYYDADRWHVPYGYLETGVKGLWNHLNFSFAGVYFHYVSEGPEFSHTRDNIAAEINVQFFWKGVVAGANFTLLPRMKLLAEDFMKEEMTQEIYLQYRWKSLTASAMWLCPLNPDGYSYEVQGLSAVHPFRHTHWTADNGNMFVLGLTWQMDFGRKFNKGEKTLNNGGYDNGMVR